MDAVIVITHHLQRARKEIQKRQPNIFDKYKGQQHKEENVHGESQ